MMIYLVSQMQHIMISLKKNWLHSNLMVHFFLSTRFAKLQKLAIGARGSKTSYKVPKMVETIDIVCILAFIHNDDYRRAFIILRSLVPTYNKCTRMWNLCGLDHIQIR